MCPGYDVRGVGQELPVLERQGSSDGDGRARAGPGVERLVPLRYGRMLTSPFAFFRGSAILQAHDLKHTPLGGKKGGRK